MSEQATTVQTFTPFVGDTFVLADAEQPLAFELTAARALPAGDGAPREPFALDFRGPAEPIVAQRTYRLEHARLGALEIFMVPVASDGDSTSYEAIFA